MERRGKSYGGMPERPRSDSEEVPDTMAPERYLDVFYQDAARRMNFILLLASRHFEARKFLLDLNAVMSGPSRPPPRRA